MLKLYGLISLPPFLIVYLYYIIKVQNPEKLSQTTISELLWIINDEYVVKLILTLKISSLIINDEILINEIWINTCFVNQKKPCFDCLIPYIVIPWNCDIFGDDYHTMKISYRYNPSCHMKRYNKIFTKMWGVYSLLWDTVYIRAARFWINWESRFFFLK